MGFLDVLYEGGCDGWWCQCGGPCVMFITTIYKYMRNEPSCGVVF